MKNLEKKLMKSKEMFKKILRKLNLVEKIIGYGSPAKATTSLNFFGISNEIEFVVEDNNLKHGKFIPGVKIPIVSKDKVEDKNNTILCLLGIFIMR